ncbi:MAG: T9SS type A sorting domain-containing protein [Candidatus Delongbacteria bacterium]|nr:T9SS type A sorting domain-containing protein [Candidatus Delongbacteria bacterium]
MKKLLLILIFAINLFAQYEWSAPVQISETGIAGEISYYNPQIISENDTISIFWIKNMHEPSKALMCMQIEYKSSYDRGVTWSNTQNATPEFTDYSNERIWDLRAVCDSENNIYVFYQKGLGFDTNSIICKTYNGLEWSEADTLTSLASQDLYAAVDNEDRMYVFWARNGYQYYTYSEKSDNRIWLEPMIFENTNQNTVITNTNIIFDGNNNLYAAGHLIGEFKGLRPGLFSYSKSEEKWNDIEEIGSFTSTSSGCALTLSSDSILTASISVGTTIDEGDNYVISKKLDDVKWTEPVYLNKDNNIYTKKMFCDKNHNLHLLERHIIDSRSELTYSYSNINIWNTEILLADENKSFSYIDAVLERDSSMIFMVFSVLDYQYPFPYPSTNYFQSKLIETGIEDSGQLTIVSYQLYQNYPNPFNSLTEISYIIEKPSNVELNIYNTKGELIENIVNQKQSNGKYTTSFKTDGINSGVYYYQLSLDGIPVETKKMLYLK